MNTHKFFIGIGVGLALITLTMGAVSLFLQTRSPQEEIEAPAPTSIPVRKPTFENLRITSSESLKKYSQVLSVASPVTIELTQPLDPKSLEYEIIPRVKVFTEIDSTGTRLTFKPETFWQQNIIYTLTVKKIKSKNNQELINPYRVEFKAINTNDEENASEIERSNNP